MLVRNTSKADSERISMDKPVAVVLAAGKGSRMNSDLPKVLCEVCGRPMIHFVLEALQAAGVGRMFVVVGYRDEDVRSELEELPEVEFVLQEEQLGTGHAVQVCRNNLLKHDGAVVVVAGDSPMLQSDSARALLDEYAKSRPACILGTLHREDPTGLGRIVRDSNGDFCGIVEEKDATSEQRKITEVNMSTYVFDCQELLGALEQIKDNNEQKEYYLTDCPGILKNNGKDVRALPVLKSCESFSINTVDELAIVEQEMQRMRFKQD